MTLIKGKFPAFPIEINGGKYFGYFDSGAKGLSLDTDYTHLGTIVPGKNARYGGGTGPLKRAYFYKIPSIKVGDIVFENQEVLARPLLKTFRYNNEKTRAVLNVGSRALQTRKAVVIVDYNLSKMLIAEKLPAIYEKHFESFEWVKDTILVRGKIGGRSIAGFILDTCAGMSSISTKLADEIPHEEVQNKSVLVRDATDSVHKAFSVKVRDFQISSVKKNNVEMFVSDSFNRRSQTLEREIQGIIGPDIFKDHVLVIDFARQKFAIF